MNRRYFLNALAAGSATGASCLLPHGCQAFADESTGSPGGDADDPLDIAALPLFCAHEHWGSLGPVGMTDCGFRADAEAGAEPSSAVSVWDVVLDPYFGGWLAAAGCNMPSLARKAGFDAVQEWWRQAPGVVLEAVLPDLRRQCVTGAFQCIRGGISALHGADIASWRLEEWLKADASIQHAYTDMFAWYREAMSRLHFSALIRPVHPEFFTVEHRQAAVERSFTSPILRIDPLLELWSENAPRRDALADYTGVYPHDAASWRACLAALFDKAAQRGNVGIKQLQAYSRTLEFLPRSDAEVVFVGALDAAQRRVFQDWMVHECCKQAHERRWPHQIHVGTHNLEQSSPLPLGALAKRYTGMNLVLLHCWPFIEESGHLAKHWPNVYLDACWQPILNPMFLEEAFGVWLGYVPATKIMCSQDATSVEMAAGSSFLVRGILSDTLQRFGALYRLDARNLRETAADLLHNNAVRVYATGEPVAV